MNHFYDTLLAHVSQWPLMKVEEKGNRGTQGLGSMRGHYQAYASHLTDPNTKRLLFDSRQATIFGDLAEPPPERAQHLLHTPFDQFYLELTEPILFGSPEEGHQDLIRAFLYRHNVAKAPILGSEDIFGLSNISIFLSTTETGNLEIVDRSWLLNLQTGMPFISVVAATLSPDPSEVGSLKPSAYFLAGSPLDMESRHIGWWERLVSEYTGLWSWMMLYCMAKGIYIHEESLSRQQRRWLERHPKAPKPWHIVDVEPQIQSAHRDAPTEGSHHSYRYDVIGHLRFTNHRVKLEDGTIGKRDYVEWIAPHQRGLANTLYIPKTYNVEGGKIIHPAFREYVGERDNTSE